MPIDILLRRAKPECPEPRREGRLAAVAARIAAGLAFALGTAWLSSGAATAGPLARLVSEPAVAHYSLIHRVAVFGTDDRIAVPDKYKAVADRIGLLFNNQTRTVCSAFCVAPNVVATAAHCLFKPGAEASPRLAEYWFARGYDRQRDFSRIAGYSTGSSSQHIVTGATRLSTRPPIDAASDWALVRLANPACRSGVLPIKALPSDTIIKAAAARRVFQIAYHRDQAQWKPVYSQPCLVDRRFGQIDWPMIARDFTTPEQLILHACDTGGASSGSPLLLDAPDGPYVIGINIGTYEQARVLVQAGQVMHRFKSETVANTGVNAGVFAAKIPAIARAQIIPSGPPLRELQTRLQMRGHYAGPIDGSYGPLMRVAIEAFEERHRLPVTGLPTSELARRLGGAPSVASVEPRDIAVPPKPTTRLPRRADAPTTSKR